MKFAILYIILYILFSSHLFNYVEWKYLGLSKLNYIFSSGLFFFTLIKNQRLSLIKCPLRKIVLLLFSIPLISVFIEQIYYQESLKEEISTYLLSLSFLIYFVFNYYNFSEKLVVRIIIALASIAFCIQIFQLMFPEKAIFGVYDYNEIASDNIALQRNDLFRFRIGTAMLSLFALYFFWTKMIERFTIFRTLFFLIFMISVYLYLTRQILIFTTITLFISVCMQSNNKLKLWAFSILSLLVIVAGVSYYDIIFKELVEISINDTYSVDQRLLSLKFYFNQSFDDLILFLFGHCHTQEYIYWQKELDLWSSDVGFIGELYVYGFIWVVLYFYTIYIILYKYRKVIPLYIRLFVIGTFLNSLFIFPYVSTVQSFVWIAILYLSEKYIVRSCRTFERNIPSCKKSLFK